MPNARRSVTGHVIWITGAASGMGEATATRFAAEGARLILTDIHAERLRAVADRLAATGAEATPVACDLRDPASAGRVAELIRSRDGRLDMLVNCAGFNVAERRWSELKPEGAAAVIETNLTALFYTVGAALPFMRARRSGLLTHISSTDGWRVGMTGGPAYSASKHGVVAMSHTINLEEAANGIRSCVICPGGVDTRFLDQRQSPPTAEQRERLLRPADIADLIFYVASAPPYVRFDQVVITPAFK
jgi:NAD(P)-dependent dehydrogenase (short-subunit alcohol dehydrogenase family)